MASLSTNRPFLLTPIEFLKGVGPLKAEALKLELKIFTFFDLLCHYPFRHEDRTQFIEIAKLSGMEGMVQLRGEISFWEILGEKKARRLVAYLHDETDSIELIWFAGIEFVQKSLVKGQTYVAYGRLNVFNNKFSIAHPELEIYNPEQQRKPLEPVYNTTEKLRKKGLDSKGISRLISQLFAASAFEPEENIPFEVLQKYSLSDRKTALKSIHFPENEVSLQKASYRLKFEELYYFQLRMLSVKGVQANALGKGFVFSKLQLFTEFYNRFLPFQLTEAQKRVIKEIRQDVVSGKQMSRLLQGDVGSGKTIVAFMVLLMAVDNEAQGCLMAPTEILAQQHYHGLSTFANQLNVSIAILTGTTTRKEREVLFSNLANGSLKILVGTHALLEENVKFHKLGLCIIDEQHRFGVAQRARLWKKNAGIPPHILVMTATPIPRTLAMTLYGDLDLSVIDQLPPGRKEIQTIYRHEGNREKVYNFLLEEIKQERQVYIVFPLIEESETLDYQNLVDGVERIRKFFQGQKISVVHGRMKASEKESEMQKFIRHETQIMVATTVIEVGVNVPNATVMLIENAEKFGLSQLHQLRGRVGRGAEKSYCILLTGNKVSKDARVRLETMARTSNGFEIADVDLKLRGPGDLLGTQQSGILDLKLTDLSKDTTIIEISRNAAYDTMQKDPKLTFIEHSCIRQFFENYAADKPHWGVIS